jgi:hypothetical protein
MNRFPLSWECVTSVNIILIRIFFTAILVTLFAVNLSAGPKQKKTNLEIFDKYISGELEKLFYLPGINREQNVVFFINENKDTSNDARSEFITGIIKKTSSKNGLKFSIAKDYSSFETDSAYNKFLISIGSLNTSYPKFIKKKFLGEKTIQRKITAKLDIDIFTGVNSSAKKQDISVNYTDEIDYDNYESYETEDYAFTKAEPPQVSIFEDLIIPAAIVLVSAAATILFFTIRTK